MKKIGLLVCALSFVSAAVCHADTVEQSLIKAGCEQNILVSATQFDGAIVSNCAANAQKVLDQSEVPSPHKVQDLLTFRVRLVLKTCENADLDFERGCLRNASYELQKSYAQNDIDINGTVLACPEYEKYFSMPGSGAKYNANCMIDKLKSIGKISS